MVQLFLWSRHGAHQLYTFWLSFVHVSLLLLMLLFFSLRSEEDHPPVRQEMFPTEAQPRYHRVCATDHF
eukprot:gene524-290_t